MKRSNVSGLDLMGQLLFIALMGAWLWAIFIAPTEEHMGQIYRIIYLHVPSAFSAFFGAFILFVLSIVALAKKKTSLLPVMKASAEVALVFTLLTLFTGSLWGYPTWGTFWTWDARLTTTLLLAILLGGYLLADQAAGDERRRLKVSAALGIIIFADVPIIYKSVTWWRTLHQPPTLMREGGSTMAPEMLNTLVANILIMLALSLYFVWKRGQVIKLAKQIEDETFAALQS
jgi:heme exporter protein C